MSSNKRTFTETTQITQDSKAKKPSPEEQAFSNTLILDNIFNYLSAQKIIHVSLVNKSFCAASREFLRIKSNNKKNKSHYPVCIQIRNVNPCRSLARFNSYLAENVRDSSKQEMLTFNGIQQTYRNGSFTYKCKNCLIKDLIPVNRSSPMNDSDSDFSRDSTPSPLLINLEGCRSFSIIEDVYGEILRKVKFKYIRFNAHVPITCPFAILMDFLISERRDEIVELDFKFKKFSWEELEDVFNRRYFAKDQNDEPRCFPNLEIFAAPNLERNFPILAPALKSLKNFYLNPKDLPRAQNFPHHAVTTVQNHEITPAVINRLIELIQQYRPNLENLYFNFEANHMSWEQEIFHDDAHRKRLFELGGIISSRLKTLQCSLSCFISMVSAGFFSYRDDGVEIQNQFPSLKELMLAGWLEPDVIEWFRWIEISKNFPRLEKVVFAFNPRLNILDINNVSGPYNQNQSCVCEGVETLKLERKEEKEEDEQENNEGYSPGMVARVFKVFPSIRHLDLKHMILKLNSYDRIFAEIMNEIENLPFLEELSVVTPTLRNFYLDHIFVEKEKITRYERMLGEDGMEHLMLFKCSVLDHKKLKRITIGTPKSACHNYIGPKCFSDQRPDQFLVSSRTAKNICKYLPGFQFHLTIWTPCDGIFRGDGCKNNVGIDGLRLEHLHPYTTITTTVHEGGTDSGGRLRVIEFNDIHNDDNINIDTHTCTPTIF